MPLNGTSNNCATMIVTNIQNVTQWGINSVKKYFHYSEVAGAIHSYYRNYNSFFGLVYKETYFYVPTFETRSIHTMKGCVINGVVYGDTIVTNIKECNIKIPYIYFLNQNYPNPFNPTTKIRYEIPKSTNIKLTVYDITGKEISILANQKVSSGSYEVEFNGENLPSGVYFYKLETNDFIQTNKMILLK